MTDVSTIYEMTDIELAQKLLQADKEKVFAVVQIVPAVRVTLGEKFGLSRGEDALPKLSFALRMMGADAVVDTAIAQDALTLTQVKAVKNKKEQGGAPVMVGKGEGFVSPMEISARLLKNHYAVEGKSVRVIAVVCCANGKNKVKGADVVLTADELAEMVKAAEINLRLMQKAEIDIPFGVASGAAYICAASGGKAEAVARCLSKDKSRSALQKLVYSGLYGKSGVREASLVVDGQEWKFAVVACPEAAEKIRADVEKGVCEYDFVEFTCGGCISKGLENCEDKGRTLKLRGLGLRYLDKAHAARSADVSPYPEMLLKEWEAMVRSGEACAENTPITEEELAPAPIIEEVVEEMIEEVVEENPVIEEVVEEPVEEVVEEPVEEVVEEMIEEVVEKNPVIEETLIEEVVEEVVEEPVEEVIEEVVEEVIEEMIEEVVEENPVIEETLIEEVVEEVVEEPVEEVIEEVVEEVIEEVVEEIVEEAPIEEAPIEEAFVEVPVVEETPAVEETAQEEVAVADSTEEENEAAKRDTYHRRLSSTERRKLKRKNKNGK